MTNRSAPEATALAHLVAPARGGLHRAAALSVAAALVWPLQAGILALALGGLVAGREMPAAVLAAGFAGLGLLRAALALAADAAAQGAAETVVGALRDRIVAAEARRAADSPFGGAGAIAALAAEKAEALAPYVTRYAPARARVAIVPPLLLILTAWQSWAAAAVLAVAGPLIPVFMALVGMAAREASARQMAEIGSLNDLLVERLSALVDIRLLGAAGPVRAGFAASAAELRARTMAVLRVAFLSSTVLELFAALGVAMVAVYVGFSLLGLLGFGSWGGPLSPEAGIFLLLLAPEVFQPLRDLAAAWHDRAAALAVADEVAAWQAAGTPALPGTGGRAAPLPGPARIRVTGCATPGGAPLPEIAIAAGETIALVGPSGAGKTTLLRLIAGLAAPGPGRVEVAGRVLDRTCADAWRARIGWMPQAPHFLAASLRRNVTLDRGGDPGPALERAAVGPVVAALPRGLDTRLGETGTGLSGGEARRVMLARAVHGRPDVILADEPTADLDAGTAADVAEGLLAAARDGATLIVATHDMALARRMDRIVTVGGAA